jgi:hypothetical protein
MRFYEYLGEYESICEPALGRGIRSMKKHKGRKSCDCVSLIGFRCRGRGIAVTAPWYMQELGTNLYDNLDNV